MPGAVSVNLRHLCFWRMPLGRQSIGAVVAKSKIEKKLLKATNSGAALESEIPLIMPPAIFDQVLKLSKKLLQVSPDQITRDQVAKLALTFRQEAFGRHGHDTPETFAFADMLFTTTSGGFKPKPPRPDSLTHIANYRRRESRLDAFQEDAADWIIKVWQAYGRGLMIAGRGFEGGGSRRSQVVQPVEVMGEDIWEHYQARYKPWYRAITGVLVDRRKAGSKLTVASLVFRILVEDVYPEELDGHFALLKGTCLKVLKLALSAYSGDAGDLAKLEALRNPPPEPKSGGQDGRSGVGGYPNAQNGRTAASG